MDSIGQWTARTVLVGVLWRAGCHSIGPHTVPRDRFDCTEEKRVNPAAPPPMYAGEPVLPLIAIRSSARKPGDSFITIPYRKQWFWIDDRDLRSKTIFTFMIFVFSLTETQSKEGAPIVTIPAG